MSKPSIRIVEKEEAYLSTGEGLNGNTPFITGSSIVCPGTLKQQLIHIDIPHVEIRSILVKNIVNKGSTPEEELPNIRLRLTEKAKEVEIGASANGGAILSLDALKPSPEPQVLRTIKFTGTDGKELETADLKLEGVEKNKNEFTYLAPYKLGPINIEINAADKGIQQFINTNFTSANMGQGPYNSIKEFHINTHCDWTTPINESFLSYSGLAAHKINIGIHNQPAIFNIILNGDTALLSNVPLILPTSPINETQGGGY